MSREKHSAWAAEKETDGWGRHEHSVLRTEGLFSAGMAATSRGSIHPCPPSRASRCFQTPRRTATGQRDIRDNVWSAWCTMAASHRPSQTEHAGKASRMFFSRAMTLPGCFAPRQKYSQDISAVKGDCLNRSRDSEMCSVATMDAYREGVRKDTPQRTDKRTVQRLPAPPAGNIRQPVNFARLRPRKGGPAPDRQSSPE